MIDRTKLVLDTSCSKYSTSLVMGHEDCGDVKIV